MTNFIEQLKAGFEGNCPCCGRFSKMYRRQINSGVAIQLIKLYRLGGASEYIHASLLINKGVSGAGDLTKAKYWGLIQSKTHTPSEKKSSGYWKLTEMGIDFVKHDVEIKKCALVFDDNVIGFEGNYINITQCLGEKFDYQQLMER